MSATEAREFKKKRGVGPRGIVFDVSYDEETDCINQNLDLSIPSIIFEELSKLNIHFRRFYVQKMFLEVRDKELREKFGQNFIVYADKLLEFNSMLAQNYMPDDFIEK